MTEHRHNKALHPTAYVPLVPRFTSAAGELGRYAAHIVIVSEGVR